MIYYLRRLQDVLRRVGAGQEVCQGQVPPLQHLAETQPAGLLQESLDVGQSSRIYIFFLVFLKHGFIDS